MHAPIHCLFMLRIVVMRQIMCLIRCLTYYVCAKLGRMHAPIHVPVHDESLLQKFQRRHRRQRHQGFARVREGVGGMAREGGRGETLEVRISVQKGLAYCQSSWAIDARSM